MPIAPQACGYRAQGATSSQKRPFYLPEDQNFKDNAQDLKVPWGRPDEHGAVLVLVLTVLAALSALAVLFSRDILLDAALSSSTRSILAAKPLMESGERLAAALLVANNREGTPDHPHEDWARFDVFLQKLSTRLQTAALSGAIEDENSLFPLNAIFCEKEADRPLADAYAQLLTRMLARRMLLCGYDNGLNNAYASAGEFVSALRIWGGERNPDDATLAWHLAHEPRFLPPGRPLLGLEELLLVRWPHVKKEWAREVLLGTPSTPGLVSCLSLWSRGPLNMNTLRSEVLAALVPDPAGAAAFTQAVERRRGDPDNDLSGQWYSDLLVAYGVPPLPKGMLDVRSRWYRLRLAVRQGTRENMLTSIGWVTNEYVAWEYRVVH